MKIIKTTHFRGDDEFETSDFTWFEGNDKQEFLKKLQRLCNILSNFEGLECIAKCPEENYAVFAEGLSKEAYWVKVTVVEQ